MKFGYAVYFTDRSRHRVLRWDPDSDQVDIIAGDAKADDASQQLKEPYGLAFLTDGTLIVADKFNHRICRIRESGLQPLVLKDSRGSRAPRPDSPVGYNPKLYCPTGLFAEPSGSFLCSFADDQTIYRILPGGEIELVLGICPNRGYLAGHVEEMVQARDVAMTPLRMPAGIVGKKDGTIFFIERREQIVRRYHPDQGLRSVFSHALRKENAVRVRAPQSSRIALYHPAYPGGLALDKDEVLYVSDLQHGCVLRVDEEASQVSRVLEVSRSEGEAALGIAAIAFGADGTAWAVNAATGSVEAYEPRTNDSWRAMGVRLSRVRGEVLSFPNSGCGLALGG